MVWRSSRTVTPVLVNAMPDNTNPEYQGGHEHLRPQESGSCRIHPIPLFPQGIFVYSNADLFCTWIVFFCQCSRGPSTFQPQVFVSTKTSPCFVVACSKHSLPRLLLHSTISFTRKLVFDLDLWQCRWSANSTSDGNIFWQFHTTQTNRPPSTQVADTPFFIPWWSDTSAQDRTSSPTLMHGFCAAADLSWGSCRYLKWQTFVCDTTFSKICWLILT